MNTIGRSTNGEPAPERPPAGTDAASVKPSSVPMPRHTAVSDQNRRAFDLRRILSERNPRLLNRLPPGVLALARSLTHEHLVNAVLTARSGLEAAEFCEYVLRRLEITLKLENSRYLEDAERPVICANHPSGGLEGVALIAAILRIRGSCRVPANDLLATVEPLGPLIVGVNRARPSVADMRELSAAYQGNEPMLIFPAGVTARVYGGVLREYPWETSFVTRARRADRDIVPVWVSGRNSRHFYLIHRIRRVLGIGFNLEMGLLVDELLRRRGDTLTLRFAPARRVEQAAVLYASRNATGSAAPNPANAQASPAGGFTHREPARTADRRYAQALRREVEALAHHRRLFAPSGA